MSIYPGALRAKPATVPRRIGNEPTNQPSNQPCSKAATRNHLKYTFMRTKIHQVGTKNPPSWDQKSIKLAPKIL